MTLQGHAGSGGDAFPKLGNVRQSAGPCRTDGRKFGIVVSRYNERLTRQLVESAVAAIRSCGAAEADIEVFWVPGAFEIPLAAKKMAESGKYDAVICLGAVIRGETDHYEHVATEVTKGVAMASLSSGIPVLYGVLTTDTIEQAINRAGLKSGNKGFECAMDALEMASLFKKLEK